jgi:hypothetical protein
MPFRSRQVMVASSEGLMSMAGTLIHDEVRIEKKLTVRSLWNVICCEDLILGFFMM